VLDWGRSSPLKGAQPPLCPQFSLHVYCGQTAGWMKTPLGMEVDLGPGHIVLDGVPALHERAQQPPSFRPMSIVATVAHLSYYWAVFHFVLALFLKLSLLLISFWAYLWLLCALWYCILLCWYICLDWLVSRRHCSQNWPQMIVPVREKINSAIQDMPAVEDVANLLRGTCLYIATIRVGLFWAVL